MCSWTVAIEELSPLPGLKGETEMCKRQTKENRRRQEQKKKIKKEKKKVSIKRRNSDRSKKQLYACKKKFKKQLDGDLEKAT